MRLVTRACGISMILLLTGTGAFAEPVKCRSTISKATAKYVETRMRELAKCEDRVVVGSLPSATDCEIAAGVKLAAAAAKLRRDVDRACGGADRVCGGGDDDGLASIGWDLATCPDPYGAGCVNSIADCGDVADCLSCAADAASERLRALYFDALLTTSDRAVIKCQRTVGKATVKFLAARSKALGNCWAKVSSGQADAPCPAPGDGKAAATIAKAESKKIAAICKACGGADRGCDGAVGSIPGTGGSDDLTPGTVGFVASCPDVTVPGAATSCAGAGDVDALADLVDCVDCATAFESDCMDALAVPWSQPLPAACAAPGSTPNPTATPTPTSTATPTATAPAPTPTSTCGSSVYAESFTGPNGSTWPSPWTPIGSVDVADLQSGRARFRPTLSGYSLARLHAPLSESNVEARLTIEFADIAQQGIGFYVRQNGGYLQSGSPHGQGYAVFVEGFRGFQGIGVWREIDGNEQQLLIDTGHTIVNGTRYRVRFQVEQVTPTTTALRAKFWPESDAEPMAWDVEYVDDALVLQGVSGGLAADSWSSIQSGGPTPAYTFIDDVDIVRLCVP